VARDPLHREERKEREAPKPRNDEALPAPQPNPAHSSIIRRSYNEPPNGGDQESNNNG
jgi:hypothetical protein